MIPFAQADTVDFYFDGASTEKSATSARKDILSQAIEAASFKYISEIVGEQRLERNTPLIRDVIISQSGKYIPVIKSSQVARAEAGYTMIVEMKVAVDQLKTILTKEGLLYKTKGIPSTLLFVDFDDKVHSKSEIWWSEDSRAAGGGFLAPLYLEFKKQLESKGFYVYNPFRTDLVDLVPQNYRRSGLRTDDLLLIGEYLQADLIFRGRATLSRVNSGGRLFRIDIKLVGIQTNNGRVIGEITRRFETNVGPFERVVREKLSEVGPDLVEDLSVQILDSWQKGRFGADLLKLAFRGRLEYPQVEALKTGLNQLREIRSVRERFIGPEEVVFEVDVAENQSRIVEKLQSVQLPQMRLTMDKQSAGEVVYRIQARP